MNDGKNDKAQRKFDLIKKYFFKSYIHLFLEITLVIVSFSVGYWLKSLLSSENTAFIVLIILTAILSTGNFIMTQLLQEQVKEVTLDSYINVDGTLGTWSSKTETLVDDVRAHLGISTKYLTNEIIDGEMKDHAYEESLSVIKGAKHSIWIVGDYSPKRDSLIRTEERSSYFLEIENIIQKKIAGKEKFEYKRIMQRNELIFKQIRDNQGRIDKSDQIAGDEQAFEHCSRVLKLASSQVWPSGKISLIVTPVAPSMPSILLVDGTHLLFTIPRKLEGDLIRTEGVIHFRDYRPSKPMIKSFKSIFQSIFEDDAKHRIVHIDDQVFKKGTFNSNNHQPAAQEG